MTGFNDCGDVRAALGVYVVGAIEPAERAVVDAHLARCRRCREELAGLAGLPALLGRVPAADVERMVAGAGAVATASGSLLGSLLDRVASRRKARRLRVAFAAAAAAVVVAGGGVAGGLAAAHGSAPRPVTAVAWDHASGRNAATGVIATVAYRGLSWGTAMRVQVHGIAPGTTCEFWVLGPGGQRIAAGGWTVTQGWNSPGYPASTPIHAGAVRGFQITSGGTPLVTIKT
jgi:hypothetical protein